jgi:hypothetical protein
MSGAAEEKKERRKCGASTDEYREGRQEWQI